jgi:hypothetical protein
MEQALLADGVEYVHGMTIYDINGNDKDGDYIENSYTIKHLDEFTVDIGGVTWHNNAGWYLCPNGVDAIGFELSLLNYYSSKQSAISVHKAKKRLEIEKKIAYLTDMLKELE